jgi:hypothetical protein
MAKLNSKLQELKDQSTQDILGVKVLDEAKFAELIINACLEIVDDEGCGEGGSFRAIGKIKDHFGVE